MRSGTMGLALGAALAAPSGLAADPLSEKIDLFAEGLADFASYRIPGIVVTTQDRYTPDAGREIELNLTTRF